LLSGLIWGICGILGEVQYFFYLCVEYSNATTATILQFISPVFILFYNRLVYQKRASKSAVFYVLVAMLGV
ncbi:EamA family transporter, partial [Streptococcus pneumoniae]|uniref:EamA family transporter n=1 Tax=Streptococcus pneumoniae TaxID=1313 RepID=UPI000AB9CA45